MSKNQNDRIYVGKGVKVRGDFGLINISIAESKLNNHWYEYNGERYIKLTVGALRQTDQYGKTHSVWVNDYQPEGQANSTPKMEKAPLEDDMPF